MLYHALIQSCIWVSGAKKALARSPAILAAGGRLGADTALESGLTAGMAYEFRPRAALRARSRGLTSGTIGIRFTLAIDGGGSLNLDCMEQKEEVVLVRCKESVFREDDASNATDPPELVSLGIATRDAGESNAGMRRGRACFHAMSSGCARDCCTNVLDGSIDCDANLMSCADSPMPKKRKAAFCRSCTSDARRAGEAGANASPISRRSASRVRSAAHMRTSSR